METWAYQIITISFVVLIVALTATGIVLAVNRGRKFHEQKNALRQLMTEEERKLLIIEDQKQTIELMEIESKTSAHLIKILESKA